MVARWRGGDPDRRLLHRRPGRLSTGRVGSWSRGPVGLPIPIDRSLDVDEPADMAMAEDSWRPVPSERCRSPVGSSRSSVFVIAEAGVNHNGRPGAGSPARRRGRRHRRGRRQVPDVRAGRAAAGERTDRRLPGGRRRRPPTTSARCSRLCVCRRDAWAGCRTHARDRGIVFLSTPFDDESADLLDAPRRAGVQGRLGRAHQPAVPRAPRSAGRPMIVSTGMADLVEVADAVDAIAAAGDPPSRCSIASRTTRPGRRGSPRDRDDEPGLRCPAGWSDHTPGIGAGPRGRRARRDHHREAPDARPDHARSRPPPRSSRTSSRAWWPRSGR